jgi:hypothetical protein
MDLRRTLCLAALAAAALNGCRTAPYVGAHIESLNAEYRQLEDYVYCLEDENARLKQELDDLEQNYDRVRRGEAPLRPSPYRRRTEPSASPSGTGPNLEPPMIELPGTPSSTPPNRSILNKPTDEPSGSLDLVPPAVELPAPLVPKETSAPQPPRKPADSKITHITLNPTLTGGTDLDGRPGDDGLSVVIEPRNAASQYVPEAGVVSIVVLDPSQQGDAARIARWDFNLSTMREKLQSTGAADGIRLQMPWPANPPQTSPLHLFVRYETADGRRLQADRELFLAAGDQTAGRWTPRPPDRQRPAAIPHAELAQSPVANVPPAGSPATASTTPTIKSPIAAGPSAAPQLLAPPPALSGDSEKPPPPTWSPFR